MKAEGMGRAILAVLAVLAIAGTAGATLTLVAEVGGSPYPLDGSGAELAVGMTVDVLVVQDAPNPEGNGGAITVTMAAAGGSATDTTPDCFLPSPEPFCWEWTLNGGADFIDNGDGTWSAHMAKAAALFVGTPGIGSCFPYFPFTCYVSTIAFSFEVTETTDLVIDGTWDLVDYDGVVGGTVNCIAEYHVDGVNGNDANDGLSRETAFATIQKGIDTAFDGDTVLVWPGVYNESIYFIDKAITVKAAADAAILEAAGFNAVSFYTSEGQDTVLANFVIRDSNTGIFVSTGTPTISNITLVDNDLGIEAENGAEPNIINCILWYNDYDLYRDPVPLEARYSCIEETGAGEGNISSDPLFADPCNGDYHLKSRNGRWDPGSETWVTDDNTSPCVNAGDPAFDPMDEPDPCGGRINMGAYGGTAYASMTAIGDYYVLEDFESYTTDFYDCWKGTGNITSGTYYGLHIGGYIHGGVKSLWIWFDNKYSPYYGGVSRTETPWVPADWTFAGSAETLSLWFMGDPNLATTHQMYARLKDSSNREAVVYYTDNWPVDNFNLFRTYVEWNIALEEFTDANPSIDLTNVKTLEIGVGDPYLGVMPLKTGEGYIYIDDIRLYPRRCILKYGQPEADINDDCVVDKIDLSIMAGDWLDYDYSITAVAVDPCDANLVAHWKLDGNALDSGPDGHHGTVVGNPIWDPNGKVDGAVELPQSPGPDYINCGGDKGPGDPNTWADIDGEITVTAWVRPYFNMWWQSFGSIVSKGKESAWELHKAGPERQIAFFVACGDNYEAPWNGVAGTTDLWDNKWHHVAGVYEIHQAGVSSEILVYTDGAKEACYAMSGKPINTNDWPVAIGANIETMIIMEPLSWYGHIDDVRIYNRALSHAEVLGVMKEAPIGPVAQYEFEIETGGITPDSSGGHDGTLVNGASIVYDADRDSNVLELDGVDSYVELADSGHDLNEPNCTDEPANCTWADITGEFTLMAWVKPDISDSGNYAAVVVGKGDDGGYHRDYPSEPNRPREGWSLLRRGLENEVTISMTGDLMHFTPPSGMVLDLVDVNVWDGKWHHIAAVYDDINWIDVYVDGILAGHHWARPFDYLGTIGTTNYPIWIGANVGEVLGGGSYGDGYHGWKGRIDDVRIYDRHLTQMEVANAMSGADVYLPLDSLANLYDEELINNKIINFRDYAILANDWLEDDTFPFGY